MMYRPIEFFSKWFHCFSNQDLLDAVCLVVCECISFFGQRKQTFCSPINFRLWHFRVYPTKLRIKSFHANQNHAIITRYSRQRWSIVQTVEISRKYSEKKVENKIHFHVKALWSVWIAPKLAQWCVISQTNFFWNKFYRNLYLKNRWGKMFKCVRCTLTYINFSWNDKENSIFYAQKISEENHSLFHLNGRTSCIWYISHVNSIIFLTSK